jgi:hypothetical protein
MFSDRLLLIGRAPGKEIAHAPRELLDVLGIKLLPPFGRPFTGEASRFRIREALSFRPCERGFFDQHSLPFVPFPRTAKPDDYGTEGRIPTGASRERGRASSQEHEVIEICTREAQGPLCFHPKKASLPQFFAALRAHRVSEDPKHYDLSRGLSRRPRGC